MFSSRSICRSDWCSWRSSSCKGTKNCRRLEEVEKRTKERRIKTSDTASNPFSGRGRSPTKTLLNNGQQTGRCPLFRLLLSWRKSAMSEQLIWLATFGRHLSYMLTKSSQPAALKAKNQHQEKLFKVLHHWAPHSSLSWQQWDYKSFYV